MERLTKAMEIIKSRKDRSAWDKGVSLYALELLEELEEQADGGYIDPEDLETSTGLEVLCLNGADSWNQYSFGGYSLIYDWEIAERLCTPSELKKKKGGELDPSRDELWMDVQTRALKQAFARVRRAIKNA